MLSINKCMYTLITVCNLIQKNWKCSSTKAHLRVVEVRQALGSEALG